MPRRVVAPLRRAWGQDRGRPEQPFREGAVCVPPMREDLVASDCGRHAQGSFASAAKVPLGPRALRELPQTPSEEASPESTMRCGAQTATPESWP